MVLMGVNMCVNMVLTDVNKGINMGIRQLTDFCILWLGNRLINCVAIHAI